jgi:hypothetical protein
MTKTSPHPRPAATTAAVALLLSLVGCGGGNPLSNSPDIDNSSTITGKKLSLAYYQRCIQPILEASLASPDGGGGVNECASSGCHDNASGTGGALRVVPGAASVDLTDPANTAELVRSSEIYRNFYSAQGVTVPGAPSASRLLNKPLVRGVLHGGGRIFASTDDANAKVFTYWINKPVPTTSDEFDTSEAVQAMFEAKNGDQVNVIKTGTCKTE